MRFEVFHWLKSCTIWNVAVKDVPSISQIKYRHILESPKYFQGVHQKLATSRSCALKSSINCLQRKTKTWWFGLKVLRGYRSSPEFNMKLVISYGFSTRRPLLSAIKRFHLMNAYDPKCKNNLFPEQLIFLMVRITEVPMFLIVFYLLFQMQEKSRRSISKKVRITLVDLFW